MGSHPLQSSSEKLFTHRVRELFTATMITAITRPDMVVTIVSVNRNAKASYSVPFEGDLYTIKHRGGRIIGTIPVSVNGLYKVDHY
jgi:hypothetical protein